MSDIVSSGAGALKKAKPVLREIPKDSRTSMLDTIKGGGFNLRRAVVQPKKATGVADTKAGTDVMSILARRVALEASDERSSGEEEEADDDWD